ncbi:enoyl-CoA hydratase/isomerase family protein [Amycolatopsis sp. NPDC049691]|uniref:enoyl-CoA hydratase/isomerase family protein n=1 Tax=Amycolatopsis sp. NPDC049691 TaxID=3155155 RepID=UPI00341F26A4
MTLDLQTDGPLLVSEPAPHVFELRLNRPDRLNALDPDLLSRLRQALDAAAEDLRVRVIVLSGAGRGFCAGFDLDALGATWSAGLPELLSAQESWAATCQRLVDHPVPVIAAVTGPAVGAGMSLALAADLRVVTAETSFGAAFVRVGLSGADLGLSWTLPRTVGMGLAAEIMFTGRQVRGEEAYRIGLANRLCAGPDVLAVALELAAEIAANSPFGVRLTKQVLHAGVDASSFTAATEIENRNQILASRTEDMAEAYRALRECRKPTFRNR